MSVHPTEESVLAHPSVWTGSECSDQNWFEQRRIACSVYRPLIRKCRIRAKQNSSKDRIKSRSVSHVMSALAKNTWSGVSCEGRIPGSKRSKETYILTYSRLTSEYL